MFRNADDKAAWRQFVGSQMNGAAGTDLHCWRPHPAQRLHDTLDGCSVDTSSGVAGAAFAFAGAFMNGGAIHHVVDLLVGAPRRDGNRANDAIAGFAFVSGGEASSVIVLKMPGHGLVGSRF